jgi:hypothetical protein
MWIDETERNTHIKIQAQTYLRLKDTKLATSGAKGQKKIQHNMLFCHFPSLHNDFVNFVSFKENYV